MMKNSLVIVICLLFFACKCKENQPGENKPILSSGNENPLLADLERYPDSLPLLQYLAGNYVNDQKYDSAIMLMNAAVAKNSINPELWDMRSAVFAAKGDTTTAIASLEKAIALYPLPDYIISLGALYAETRNAKALEMADALLIGTKAHAEKEAYFIKGLYYSFSNMKEKSIPFFDRALQADYQFMDAYLEKGLALYELKKYNDAATVLLRAVTLQNNFDRGYFYLGRCYEKLGKKEDASDAYRKALLYDPEYTEANDALKNLAL